MQKPVKLLKSADAPQGRSDADNQPGDRRSPYKTGGQSEERVGAAMEPSHVSRQHMPSISVPVLAGRRTYSRSMSTLAWPATDEDPRTTTGGYLEYLPARRRTSCARSPRSSIRCRHCSTRAGEPRLRTGMPTGKWTVREVSATWPMPSVSLPTGCSGSAAVTRHPWPVFDKNAYVRRRSSSAGRSRCHREWAATRRATIALDVGFARKHGRGAAQQTTPPSPHARCFTSSRVTPSTTRVC